MSSDEPSTSEALSPEVTNDSSSSTLPETTVTSSESSGTNAAASGAGANRRRIAFVLRERPPPPSTSTAPLATVKQEPPSDDVTDSGVADSGGPTSSGAPSGAPQDPPKLIRKAWSVEEVSAFFEGIKIYGKDFDSVVKFMAKRKIEKTKDHIKTFFFNSVKSYRQLLAITDDDFPNIPRDARELFLLVNACEWKRKTLNMKITEQKFRELLYTGTVNVRAGRRIVNIKTPPCPALCRYFSVKKADKIPSEVYIHLEPTSNGDHVFMRNRDQNPFLRVKLNTNDRIMKLLEFLHRKWSSAGDSSPISVTLWPDTSCEIASLSIHSVENSPFISLSMNKLIRNVEETREKMEPKKVETNGIKMATDVNTKTKSTHTIIYPKPFTLTDRVIADGITIRNVRNAILAELFCVCGRQTPIKLRYQVQCENSGSGSTEPWKTLISLLADGYGECLQPKKNIRKERPAPAPAPVEELNPPIAKKKRPEEPPILQNPPQEDPLPPCNPEADIVRQEYEDFSSQLALLKKTSRQKNVAVKRKSTNPSIATRTPKLSIRPAEVAEIAPDTAESLSKHMFAAPKCTIIPKKSSNGGGYSGFAQHLNSQPPQMRKSATEPSRMPTDFSSVVLFSPAKQRHVDPEAQKKLTDDFLSSLRTPVDTPMATPQKNHYHQFFGDDLSMSPNSTRHASQLDSLETANASVVDFTDMMYNQIRDQGNESIMTNPDLEISVTEVQQHYHEMMSSSQNSHDYVLGQFAGKRPKKS